MGETGCDIWGKGGESLNFWLTWMCSPSPAGRESSALARPVLATVASKGKSIEACVQLDQIGVGRVSSSLWKKNVKKQVMGKRGLGRPNGKQVRDTWLRCKRP